VIVPVPLEARVPKTWSHRHLLQVSTSTILLFLSGCGELRSPSDENVPEGHASAVAQPVLPLISQAPLLPLDRPLEEGEMIAAVLARNPTLVAMQASWSAAQSRYPQESAFPEPMLSYELAPLSLRESTPGMDVTLTQPIPWSQKLHGRGDAARADADVAGADLVSSRLQLISEAKFAFADYWLATGEIAVNQHEHDIVSQINAATLSSYGSGQGGRAAALQAQAMLNELDHHAILLEHARNITVARINLLVHRPSETAVPPPPRALPDPVSVPDIPELARLASERRPDLAAAAARRRRAVAVNGVVRAQDLPDISVSVGYNSMWTDTDMRFTLGVNVPLPVNRDLHAAARDEAQAEIQRADAELAAIGDRVQYEVREANERVQESWHIVHLLRERMVPTAQAMVSTTEAGIASGGRDYAALLTAQNELVDMQWQEQQALTDFHHHLADLERIVGGPLPQTPASLKEQP